MDLKEVTHYGTVSKEDQLFKYGDTYGTLKLHGTCDSTWASDRTQRQSMGGIGLMLAQGAVYYRTHLQPMIAISSTEDEFTTMVDADKTALYIRQILDKIHYEQKKATKIQVRNEQHLPLEGCATLEFFQSWIINCFAINWLKNKKWAILIDLYSKKQVQEFYLAFK